MPLTLMRAVKNYFFGNGAYVKAKVLFENTEVLSKFSYRGLHGTRLQFIQDQIKKGRLDHIGQDVYIYRNRPWNDSRAAFWAGNKRDAVIALLGSNKAPVKNHHFNTECFSRKDQDITILKIWKISSDWMRLAWRHPPTD